MVMAKRWMLRPGDSAQITELAEALGLSTITVTVLMNRGISDIESARQWLLPDQTVAHDPFLMADMDQAIDRLHQAIIQQERICCYGDYDVDGISATSLYLLFLRQQGAKVDFYIPDRKSEGYGLSMEACKAVSG